MNHEDEDVYLPPLDWTAVQGTDGAQHRFHWRAHWSLWLSVTEGLPVLSRQK